MMKKTRKLILMLAMVLMLFAVLIFNSAAASPCLNGHTPGEAEEESFEAETCTTDGFYDLVYYCTDCGEEISRETFVIPKRGHKAGEVKKENIVKATYTKEGSYEKVTYCSVCSEEIKFQKVTVKKKTLAQVKGVEWEALSDSKIKLTWKKVSGADGYRIYEYDADDREWEKVKTTSSLSYTVKDLDEGETVKFRIKAYKKGDGITAWGSASETVTASTTPEPVKAVKAISRTKNSITLKWNRTDGAKGYRVYLYNAKTKKWEKVKTTSSTSFTVTGLKADTVYKFRVKAYTKAGGKTLWGKATPTLKTFTA